MINFNCPECGEEMEFRKRITFRKRYCPFCNKLITHHEIDRQAAEARRRELAANRRFARELKQRLILYGVVWLVLSFIITVCAFADKQGAKSLLFGPIIATVLFGLYFGAWEITDDKKKKRRR